jgi:starch synthase
LFLASEADPLIKVGGLADVAGALPRALQKLTPEQTGGISVDIRLAIPFYADIRRIIPNANPTLYLKLRTPHSTFQVPIYEIDLSGLSVYLIGGDPISKKGPVYSSMAEDAAKFTFFSLAALELTRTLNWKPDILHANDWHTAPAVYAHWMRKSIDPFLAYTHTLLGLHNLPYMGAGADAALEYFGIPASLDERLPWWARHTPLPMALAVADQIIAVSPTYSQEILTPEFGLGLESLLASRLENLGGIVNGIDETMWDPAADMQIPAQFSIATLDNRINNKRSLLEKLNLDPDPAIPLLAFIGRMDQQKGIDIALEALHNTTHLSWQAVFLGTGDTILEEATRQFQVEFPERFRAITRFDAQLSRNIYAGADALLIPSRYEPCGTVQMIAMRYGCVPVASKTGGLRDTVIEGSNGFLFERANAEEMAKCLYSVIMAYAKPDEWRKIQIAGMNQDFSWGCSALKYLEVYKHLSGKD